MASKFVLLDTDIILGALLENDSNHSQAKPIFQDFDRGNITTAILTDYIFDEMNNYLTKSAEAPEVKRLDFMDRILNGKYFNISNRRGNI